MNGICLTVEEYESHIVIKDSLIPNAGQGAFIDVDVKKGSLLGKYIGEPLTNEEYVNKYPDGKSFYVLAVPGEEDMFVDASDPSKSNWTRYINHDKKSNVRWEIGGDVIATRNIPAGSELYLNYGKQYWKGWNHIAATSGELNVVGGDDLSDETLKASLVDQIMSVLEGEKYNRLKYYIEGESEAVSYVLDEVGTRIRTQSAAGKGSNVRKVTFQYAFDGMAFDILFPISKVEELEEIVL